MQNVLDHTGKPYAKLFEEISAIPRGSFKEEAIADYVVNFAKELGYNYTRDKMHNIVVYKPASPGYEGHEPVMLQGHMDMIWNKRPGSDFDFETESLKLIVKDGFLMAEETTCGSDDGVAIAYMLSILQDKALKHPPLECVFTTAEEPGLYGVQDFDCSQLKARKYISMDGNLEGTSLIIAAGGVNGWFSKKFERENVTDKVVLSIRLHGLTGAHIQFANRGLNNAIKTVARILHSIGNELSYNLVHFEGGAITTIPVDCTAKIALDFDDIEKARAIVERVVEEVKVEHKESDPGMAVEIAIDKLDVGIIPQDITKSVVDLIYLLPSGLIDFSLVFEGLPISSACVEVIKTTADEIRWFYRPASAINSKLMALKEQTMLYGKLFGIDYQIENMFFGHCIDAGTPLYNIYDEVWFEQTGEHIRPIGAHYGNEIGFFLSKMPWLDVILLVATHYDAHTPNERLDLDSFDRCYKALVGILERA